MPAIANEVGVLDRRIPAAVAVKKTIEQLLDECLIEVENELNLTAISRLVRIPAQSLGSARQGKRKLGGAKVLKIADRWPVFRRKLVARLLGVGCDEVRISMQPADARKLLMFAGKLRKGLKNVLAAGGTR